MEAVGYKCGGCDYRAEVVGGLKSKFKGDTVTYICHDCHELKELWVRRYEKGAEPIGPGPTLATPYASEPIYPVCDQDREHRIERWPLSEGTLCPRCGAPMEGLENG
ncbi:MAG: hypothetical protein KF760_27790 [Candidatus Eremiobacteraeota bacterium]|nr:hypothetical protein [Candidatus Eremiobacteraeota bacterium]MCW5872614.1 hypothetical protein [Candidatus Eremiobacteraeota bacterium]